MLAIALKSLSSLASFSLCHSNSIPIFRCVILTHFCIYKIAPCKAKRVKDNSKEWFDSVVSEEINNRDKFFKKLKKPRLPLDQENYKKARYEFKKLIAEKRESTLKQNLP